MIQLPNKNPPQGWSGSWKGLYDLHHQCQQHGYQQGLVGDLPGLQVNLRQLVFIFNFFDSAGEVARTAPGKTHAGFIAPLKEACARQEEWQEERQPPQRVGIDRDQPDQQGARDHKWNDAAEQAFASFGRADVGNADFSVYPPPRVPRARLVRVLISEWP